MTAFHSMKATGGRATRHVPWCALATQGRKTTVIAQAGPLLHLLQESLLQNRTFADCTLSDQ